jgi:uncharacterized protein (DUF1330 family)
MVNVLVTLEVKNFTRLSEFETKAVQFMRAHSGRIVKAFETKRNADNSGQEIHLLEFPSMDAFDAYRSDPVLLQYAALRNEAIESTSVIISGTNKEYS